MKKLTLLGDGILFYKRQARRTKAILWVCVLVIGIIIVPSAIRQHQIGAAHPARIYFSEPQKGLSPGQIFPVDIRLQTTGTPVNAVSAGITFNTRIMEVVNMTTENSFCTFYLDNTFDNIKGEVRVSCGLPSPGFLGDSIVARVNMRAKTVGNAEIGFDKQYTQVLANDGKGTNVTQELPSLELTFNQNP
jgi:hypothetical protein